MSWKTLTEYGKILIWQRSEIAPDEAKYSIMAKLLQFRTLIFVHTHADFDHLTISSWNLEHNNEYVLADQERSYYDLLYPIQSSSIIWSPQS